MGFFDRATIGMCAALPSFFLTTSLRTMGYLSQQCKMSGVFYKSFLDNFKGPKGEEITSKVINALCPHKTLSWAVEKSKNIRTATHAKALALSVLTAQTVLSDLIFEGVVQELVLRRLPKAILKEIKPGSETVVDSTTAKILRVLLSTAIRYGTANFFMLSGDKKFMESSSCLETYRASVVIGGLVSSLLKETSPGLIGSIGQSLTFTALTYRKVLLDC